jgi:integrase
VLLSYLDGLAAQRTAYPQAARHSRLAGCLSTRARDGSERSDTAGEPITIRKATEDFETEALNTMKASTLKQYKLLFRELNKFIDGKGLVFLKQLGVVEVREFRNSWTVGPRRAGKHLERLKRFFNFCIENEWLEVNPARPLKPPKVSDTDVIPFTEDEIKKILTACSKYDGPNRERLKVLANLMLATGLRIGDAVTIRKDRVVKTPEGYSVVLRTAKTGTHVSCPVPNALAKSLLGLAADTPFWSGKSSMEKCASNWRKIFQRAFKALR